MPARRIIVTAVLLSSVSAAVAEPGYPPPPDNKVPIALLKLRDEASELKLPQLMAELPRFRPLCDKDGYPLVGNVGYKNERPQPSDVCAAVRQGKTT